MNLLATGIYDLHISPKFWLRLLSFKNCNDDLAELIRCRTGSISVHPTDTGRSALFLALKMLNCDGGEVLVNAYTTDVVHSTIRAAGAIPVCFDINPGNLQPDMKSVKKMISQKTRAAIHTGLFGFPCDPVGFVSEITSKNVPVIEDACNSFGCSIDGQPSGSFAGLAIASFRVGKPVSSGGGALIVNDTNADDSVLSCIRDTGLFSDFARTSRVLVDHIILNPVFLKFIGRPVRKITKNTSFGKLLIRGGVVDTASLPSIGTVSDIGSIQSSLALSNLEEYEKRIEKRRKNGFLLVEGLSDIPVETVCRHELPLWNGLFFPVLLPKHGQSGAFLEFCRSRGFDVSRFHYEVPELILGSDYAENYPGTYELTERLVCLPCPESSRIRDSLVSTIRLFLDSTKDCSSA